MQFEYEVRLSDGRTVAVTGEAEVTYHCDCGGNSHDHIDAIEIESAVLLVHGEEFLEMDLPGHIARELEDKIEGKLYSEMAEVA